MQICMRNGTGCLDFEVKHLEKCAREFDSVQVTAVHPNKANKILHYIVLQVRKDPDQTADRVRDQAAQEGLHTAQHLFSVKQSVKKQIETDGQETATPKHCCSSDLCW